MSMSVTYPGVYIEETPRSVHSIQGVDTSITAFIGTAKRGPTNRATAINSFIEYEKIFGGLWKKSNMSYAVYHYFLNGGQDALIVRVHDGAKAARYEIDGSNLKLQASSAGMWGANLDIRVSHTLYDIDIKSNNSKSYDNEFFFSLIVKDILTTSCEIFHNISNNHNDKRFIGDILNKYSNLIRVSRYVSKEKRPPKGHFKLVKNSANDGKYYLADNTIIGKRSASSTGMYSLHEPNKFNMLCIPPYNKDNATSKTVWVKALEYCESRGAILIVDPPNKWTAATDTDKEFGDLRSPNAALYFPRINVPDPLNEHNSLGSFVSSGAIAGVIAKIDKKRGVWKTPAGIDATIVGASALTVMLTDNEISILSKKGVNCLKKNNVGGIVVWGARTMSSEDKVQWKYLPVRRTALFIEESIFRGTKWIVFEPNDESLWSQIRQNVGAFMLELFRKGAFQGSIPDEAFFVKCDSETTSQYDIDRGILNIVVGFAPLKPAEFIIIKIQQLAGQKQNME